MNQISQANRLFTLDTPLGADKLLVRTFEGTETISGNFDFKLTCASEDWEIDFEQILGKTVTVALKQSDGTSERYFNGYVKAFRQIHAPGRLAMYYCEIVPWLWFLTLTADCRIFQNMSVPDIIEDTFQRFGFQDYELSVSEHDEWEYCVQYRETAFNFVNRLMEIEGIYYYFKHEQGKHTLVIIDDQGSQEDCPYESTFRFDRVTGQGYKRGPDTVYDWIPKKHLQSGKYSHKEYNYLAPTDPMYADLDAQTDDNPNPKWEIYDYPGEFDVHGEADEWARWRIEEQEVDYDTAQGGSNCRSMIAGYQFQLTEHYRSDQNGPYLIRSVNHVAQEGTLIGGSDAQEAHYENTFTCQPGDVQYRHPRKTQKPVMKGSQTAFVVGPKGEEIYTDEKARVKVKFHWDRISPGDENSSCWIRVMQQWTGKQWGQIWIPRIGQEVIVDFLEGDPDRPIITGCVYNEDNQPPYTLPDNKTVSGVQTRSTLGGSSDNYNEIKLEDKIGQEMINIQAEKDMNTLVKHDQTLTVEHDKSSEIDHDMSTLVKNDKSVEVDHDMTLLVKHDLSIEVQHNLSIEVDNIMDLTVNNDLRIAITGNQGVTVSGNQNSSTTGSRSNRISGDDQLKVDGNVSIQTGGDLYLKSSGKIVIQGMQGVTLVGPGGFIDIGAGGITIQGTMVYINCGAGAPGEAADASPKSPDTPEGFALSSDDSSSKNSAGNTADSSSSSGSSPGAGQGGSSSGWSGSSGGSSGGSSSSGGAGSSGQGSSSSGSGSGGSSIAPLQAETPQMDNSSSADPGSSGGTTLQGQVTENAASTGAGATYPAPQMVGTKSGTSAVSWTDSSGAHSEPVAVQIQNSHRAGTTVTGPTNPNLGNVQKVQGIVVRNPDGFKITRIWTNDGVPHNLSPAVVVPLK